MAGSMIKLANHKPDSVYLDDNLSRPLIARGLKRHPANAPHWQYGLASSKGLAVSLLRLPQGLIRFKTDALILSN